MHVASTILKPRDLIKKIPKSKSDKTDFFYINILSLIKAYREGEGGGLVFCILYP